MDATCGKIDQEFTIHTVYTEKDREKVLDIIDNSVVSGTNADMGILMSLAGVVFLVLSPESTAVASIVNVAGAGGTLYGAETALVSLLEKAELADIEDAMIRGNMHISYSMGVDRGALCEAWLSAEYINKVQAGIPGIVNTEIDYKTVQQYCGFKNYDND